jgi:hypothetical protein
VEQHKQAETRKEQEEHHEDHKEHIVTITVNEDPVKVAGPKATGRQIKEAAIAQGVKIDLGFILSVEKGGPGQTQVVGDNDEVTVHKESRFVAVAPDDNS